LAGHQPKFSHQELLKKIEAMADSKKCSAAQLSLAWHLDAEGLLGFWKVGPMMVLVFFSGKNMEKL
jgi:aryl-alcohol dehydrogenase-like predicted oxidoreductase